MHIILLSGGSGKRLWPLSNEVRAKQFIKIFRRSDGEYESMVQRVYCQVRHALPDATITVATSHAQVSVLQAQLGNDIFLSVEPCSRNTFPALSLATLNLLENRKVSHDDVVVACPVDSYVDDDFFSNFANLTALVSENKANIALMGIVPTYPTEKYGYILPKKDDNVSEIERFFEKPGKLLAAEYIRQGALWNGGVFACKINYIMEKLRELSLPDTVTEFISFYDKIPNNSLDYAILEKEKSLIVHRYEGKWKDIGTWNTFTEVMGEHTIGDVLTNENSVHVINELDIPILCLGLKNTVVVAGADGILVADKGESSYMKPMVEKIRRPIRYAEKSWGSYRVIDVGKTSLTVKITLLPGHSMNYHSHEKRDEIWTIIEGNGTTIVDDKISPVAAGSVVHIPQGSKHTLVAETELKAIEVQIGKDISVEDKTKYSLDVMSIKNM